MLIVKKATLIAKIPKSPLRDLVRKIHRPGNSSAQFNQGGDGRGRRMNISRIKTIRIILGPAVSEKKALLPELVASIQGGLKFVASSFATINNPRQARENKRRMEVVTPRLIIAGAIGPRTVLALATNYIACGAHRQVAKALFVS